jgi:hypothetical protein
MKTVTKLSLIAATFAAIGTSAAFADNQELQTLLSVQRAQMQPTQKSTTIAVYADRQGVSQRRTMQDERKNSRFELRSTGQGQVNGAWVPAK